MNTNDTKNFLHQMRWRNQLNRCNKEKAMQDEIMELKKENKELDKEVYKWRSKYNKLKTENRKLNELIDSFIPVND